MATPACLMRSMASRNAFNGLRKTLRLVFARTLKALSPHSIELSALDFYLSISPPQSAFDSIGKSAACHALVSLSIIAVGIQSIIALHSIYHSSVLDLSIKALSLHWIHERDSWAGLRASSSVLDSIYHCS